jgi:apolipoprotein N-acyltransferase
MRRIPVRLWALAVVSGCLQVLPFPIAGPTPVWRTIFCWFALTPLLMALTSKDTSGKNVGAWQGAALGYCSGLCWYMGNCYWIYQTMHLYGGIAKPASAGILVLFSLYLGLYHGLFGLLVASFRRAGIGKPRFGVGGALLLSPFAWVAVELARARITGFPWDLLGIAQVDNPLLTRIAPYAGAYGISFVVAAVNALWLARIEVKERKYTRTMLTVAGVAIVVGLVVFGTNLRLLIKPRTLSEMTEQPHQHDAVAILVQENLEVGAANIGPQLTKRGMLREFSKLSLYPPFYSCDGIPEMAATRCAEEMRLVGLVGPDGQPARVLSNLIVWPESPAPFEESDPEFRDALSELAREARAPVIVGNIGIDADTAVRRGYDLFNSADFIAPDGKFVGRYDKMHLVPFGEYVPFKKLFFFAGSLLQDVGNFDFGWRRTVFDVGGHKYGTFICYESIFGDEVRRFSDMGADVLVNISNDGWYGDTSAAWQHLNMARMRAIENHRWVLRATNTGVTAAIDPFGHVVTAAPRHIRTSLRVGFDYEHDLTFYAQYGDWFAYLCAMVTGVGLALRLMSKAASSADRQFE